MDDTNAKYFSHGLEVTNAIFLTYFDGDNKPRGYAWKIRSTENSFYIEPFFNGKKSSFHISVHTPHSDHPDCRFHVKVDKDKSENFCQKRKLVTEIGDKGYALPGKSLTSTKSNAKLILRIRRDWRLYLNENLIKSRTLKLPTTNNKGKLFAHTLSVTEPNTLDIDFIISQHYPIWICDNVPCNIEMLNSVCKDNNIDCSAFYHH